MFCNNCGKEIADDAKFCVYCGTSVLKIDNDKTQKINQQNTAVMDDPVGFKPVEPKQSFQSVPAQPISQSNSGGSNTKFAVILTILIIVVLLLGTFVVCVILGTNGVRNPIYDLINPPKTEVVQNTSDNNKNIPNDSNNTKNSDYFLPDSNTRIYSKSELEKMSNHDLFIARNEIFARHGRGFSNAELRDYFNSKSWYHKTHEPSEFDSKVYNTLSQTEKSNAETMLAIEKTRGSSYLNAK